MQFGDSALPSRIWDKIIPEPMSGCWLWLGAIADNGYGSTSIDGRVIGAHRAVYAALVSPIPAGLELDHLCRTRCCANPHHVEPVTKQVNISRGAAGHQWAEKSSCPVGHPYDDTNTYKSPSGSRGCRACRRDAKQRSRRQRKSS